MKNLFYWSLILFSIALSFGALNKCTEDENGLVYCENVSSQGQAFLNKRDDEDALDNNNNSEELPVLQKRNQQALETCLNDRYFKTVLDFGLFVFDSINLNSLSITNTKIAARNDITASSISISFDKKSCKKDGDTIGYAVYADNFKGLGGTINGGLHYGTSYKMPKDYSLVQSGCKISNDPNANLPFDDIEPRINDISEELAKLPSNVEIETIPYAHPPDSKKTTVNDNNIKNIVVYADEYLIKEYGQYNLNVDNKTRNNLTIIINILGESVTLKGNEYNLYNKFGNRIIWNMPNATKVTLTNGPFKGLYLAPKANARITNSSYNIQMVCKNVESQDSVSYNGYSFDGCIPNVIKPEITTIYYETTSTSTYEELQTSTIKYNETETTITEVFETIYPTSVEDRVITTTSTTEEIMTIIEMPTEFPTVPYQNDTSCEEASLSNKQVNTDIVFIFDESRSMCKYINAMRDKLNIFIQKLEDANANARFAVIGFGGKPRVYSSFTSDINEVTKAFQKLDCNKEGQESGLEAIRMFLKGSNNFIDKIGSIYGSDKFKNTSQLQWRKNSTTKTIILVTDEDSDLPTYEENFNNLQKDNFKKTVNVNSFNGKDIVEKDVKDFGGYPYYFDKHQSPSYNKNYFFEPVFSPATLKTENNVYAIYRNGSPLVLSEAYQKEVDETADLINKDGVHLFMLLNDNLADSQGPSVANSQFNENNPYWVKNKISLKDDSSTITAQYGNPLLDDLQKEYVKEDIYRDLVNKHQEKSLQGQILNNNGFCRAFNMKEIINDNNQKFVELFYETVVETVTKNVIKCVITPIEDEPPIEYPTVPYKNVTECVDEETKIKEINSDIVFIVDESASMCTYINTMKNQLNVLIDELKTIKANARYAIVGFGGKPRLYSAFTSDVTAVKNAFNKLNCHENGHESGLEAIRMFIKNSGKFINKIDSTRGTNNFENINEIKWREGSTKTIIFLSDEDSDLPIYEENRNDLQKANTKENINVKSEFDEEVLQSDDVDKFMGFPRYLDKKNMPKYSEDVYYEPAFSPAILTKVNKGKYTFYRSGTPLVLSEPYQKEVDETAKLVIDNDIQLFLLVNSKLAKSQGSDVSNSHYNDLNPYWKEKQFTEEDDSSTVTAQYGNPTIDDIKKIQFDGEEIYQTLEGKNQEKSLQGQILKEEKYCRVFKLEDFTGGNSIKMVELFYKVVVKSVKNCKTTPVPIEEDCLNVEEDEALDKLSEFNVISFSDIFSHNNEISGRIAAKNTVDIGNISVNRKDGENAENYCSNDHEKYAIYAKDFSLDGTYGSIYGGIHYTKTINLNDNTRNLLESNGCVISKISEDEIDIDSLKRRFVGISNALNELETTSEIETDGYNYNITLSKSIKHYIIEADNNTFKPGQNYYLGINNPDNLNPNDITIIINMNGDKIKFNNAEYRLDEFKERIIWNMPEANEVEYNEVKMFGLILAPKAKVIGRGGNIIGKIVCKSLDVERTEIKDADEFDACIPDIPIEEEPITVTVTDFGTSIVTATEITTSIATITDRATETNINTQEVETTSVSTATEEITLSSTATEETTLTTTTVTDFDTKFVTATERTTSIATVTDYEDTTSTHSHEIETTSVSTATEETTLSSTATEETTLTTTTVTDFDTKVVTATERTTSIATITEHATETSINTQEVETTSVSTATEETTLSSTATEETTLTTATVTDFDTKVVTATERTTSIATITEHATETSINTQEVETTSVSTATEVSTLISTVNDVSTITIATITDIETSIVTATEAITGTITNIETSVVGTIEVTSTSTHIDVETSTSINTVEETVTTTSTVEEVQEPTIIPLDTTSSVISTTSTEQPTEIIISDDEETPTTTEIEPEPSIPIVTPEDTEDEQEDTEDEPVDATPYAVFTLAGLAGAAAAIYFRRRRSIAGANQLAENVFEENVGMENPLYEGVAGQNENPLYEANLNYDSLEDNMDVFA